MPGNNNLVFFAIELRRTMNYYYENIQNEVKYVFLKWFDLMIRFQTLELIGLMLKSLIITEKSNLLK